MVSGKPLPLTVVTATGLEHSQARKALSGTNAQVVRAGISLQQNAESLNGDVISCGLAGGLRSDLETGTVVIPSSVTRPDGTQIVCDSRLVSRLRQAARAMDLASCTDPMVTSATLVRGIERTVWADRGYAAVDMETGLLQAERLACVRVILDTPSREINAAWLNGMRAAITPAAWFDLPFLMANGPRCAWLAAQVIRVALS